MTALLDPASMRRFHWFAKEGAPVSTLLVAAASSSMSAPRSLPSRAARYAGELLCTEKDAVKLWRVRPDAWAVPLEVEIEPAFWDALDRRLASQL